MNTIRILLYKILGLKTYLKLVSLTFIKLVKAGFLKKQYPELFHLHKIIKPGFTCIDIGANLGYYSVKLSEIVGENGKVYAVEPIPMFNEIWKSNVKFSKNKNLELLPYALGENEQIVQMGIPIRAGVLHHGMTKIVDTGKENYIKYFDVEMKNPDKLFFDLPRLDFIKCDIEGYEHVVFSNITKTLTKFKPIIQSELGGQENRQKVINTLKNIGYVPKLLAKGELVDVSANDILTKDQDFYFLPI
ncbi:MAG: hypothetical protein A2236_04755 [Bacteroidetes bacterium RIFOXYA2_FULL_33_7]|nr:MAG: hypothetical protein A2265_03865 [Bacteroidetes bacterium RIFOXYA12_FULL_33_9]OFY92303.1 MAG: hypothetical protein A2236_04755 [Bacteroidetes bacterium RIFOXYA2_FULL_33_7]HBX50743.1 hypothetical protein [Bacteroidales bacterium]